MVGIIKPLIDKKGDNDSHSFKFTAALNPEEVTERSNKRKARFARLRRTILQSKIDKMTRLLKGKNVKGAGIADSTAKNYRF
jgi:hypothetical protein